MKNLNKRICILGLGYIGLPSSALLASKGYKVFGVDIDSSIVNTIKKGETHIVEPNLETYVKTAVANGNLEVSSQPKEADIYIICVPTPISFDNNAPKPDLNYVISCAKSIAPLLKSGDMVILESTSPIGTTEKMKEIFSEHSKHSEDIFIAYCPERVLPGNVISELISNDRIVGGLDKRSTIKVARFYETFVEGKVHQTDAKTAEMCKLAENSFRDVNIAFANELSLIADKHNIDAWSLINLANKHPRVNILQPGPGVGGHCIAVDPWFIVYSDPENAKIIRTARKVNDHKTEWVASKIKDTLRENYSSNKSKIRISCLGISFKPNSDDLRGSPALRIVRKLMDEGYSVDVVEPNITESKELNIITLDESLEADLIIILVAHSEFLNKENFAKIKNTNFLDFCGLLK